MTLANILVMDFWNGFFDTLYVFLFFFLNSLDRYLGSFDGENLAYDAPIDHVTFALNVFPIILILCPIPSTSTTTLVGLSLSYGIPWLFQRFNGHYKSFQRLQRRQYISVLSQHAA